MKNMCIILDVLDFFNTFALSFFIVVGFIIEILIVVVCYYLLLHNIWIRCT